MLTHAKVIGKEDTYKYVQRQSLLWSLKQAKPLFVAVVLSATRLNHSWRLYTLTSAKSRNGQQKYSLIQKMKKIFLLSSGPYCHCFFLRQCSIDENHFIKKSKSKKKEVICNLIYLVFNRVIQCQFNSFLQIMLIV